MIACVRQQTDVMASSAELLWAAVQVGWALRGVGQADPPPAPGAGSSPRLLPGQQ